MGSACLVSNTAEFRRSRRNPAPARVPLRKAQRRRSLHVVLRTIKTWREEPNSAKDNMHGVTSIEYSRGLSSSGNLTLVILIQCLGFFFWIEYSF